MTREDVLWIMAVARLGLLFRWHGSNGMQLVVLPRWLFMRDYQA